MSLSRLLIDLCLECDGGCSSEYCVSILMAHNWRVFLRDLLAAQNYFSPLEDRSASLTKYYFFSHEHYMFRDLLCALRESMEPRFKRMDIAQVVHQ